MFPKNNEEAKKDALYIQAFGKRLYGDQTIYEYLLEFLLIFCSDKVKNEDGSFKGSFSFHKDLEDISYYVNPRIGLKRFIFYKKSKNENRFPIDKQCYEEIVDIVKETIADQKNQQELIAIMQDSFYGFSAVLKNRAWFAQSLLPIAPQLIFNESIGDKKERGKLKIEGENDYNKTERKFQFTRHSFMARGGEVYYLHVLQGLQREEQTRIRLEAYLKHLVHAVDDLGYLGEFIQDKWEEKKEIEVKEQMQGYRCGYIPNGYQRRASYTCKELCCILSNTMNQLDKMEYLGLGMMLQIFRMMYEQASLRIGKTGMPLWFIDVSRGNKNIRMLAEQSWVRYQEVIEEATNKGLDNIEYIRPNYEKRNGKSYKEGELEIKLMNDSKKHTVHMIRKIGKDMKLVIPKTGGRERMTFTEEIVTFLVTSLLEPMQKVTVDTFYDKLFEHFGIVIGSRHAEEYYAYQHIDQNYEIDLKENEQEFLRLLKECGYLRELSDATAIVFNPYERDEIR